MQIILKGADFSANNIGKVAIITNKAKAYSSLMALSGAKKTAVETFISNVENEGLLDKVTRLYIIAATNDYSKMFANVVSDNLSVDATPSASDFSLGSNGGIYNNGNNASIMIPTSADGLSGDDFHVLEACIDSGADSNTKRNPPFSWSYDVGVRMPSYANTGAGLSIKDSAVAGRYINASGHTDNGAFTYDIQSVGAISQKSNGRFVGAFGFSLLGNKLITALGAEFTAATDYTKAAMTENLNLCGVNGAGLLAPYGIVSIGKGMTKAQFVAYKGYMDDLAKAFGAAI